MQWWGGVGWTISQGSFLLTILEDDLTGLTWTCNSVKMGCSSIGGMGVLVVTDASRICLKICERDGRKAIWLLATQQASELWSRFPGPTPVPLQMTRLRTSVSIRWTGSNPTFPPALDDSCAQQTLRGHTGPLRRHSRLFQPLLFIVVRV